MHHPFHTTRWSVVARSGSVDLAIARRALGELCEQYWFPLYAHARRRGAADDDARDLVQTFCAHLLEHGGLDGAVPTRGRFRHYLLAAFTNFGRNQARGERAARRGGTEPTWSFDDAASRYEPEARSADGPEQVFERRWAFALLDRAFARLHADYTTTTRRETWRVLQPFLLAVDDRGHTAELAAQLSTSEGAVRVALHRLRSRWRELVRDEVAQTVADPTEIEDELQALQHALAAGRPEFSPPAGNDSPPRVHGLQTP